ncbi:helix-turn-helix domain-containing protein [Streptomyces sp. T-3]|nr:helix-turn-helix domain-containing protein [Streptomyces sp. T-3]
MTTRSWLFEPYARTYGIEVVVAPWAAFALFGTTMCEVAGAVVDLGELAGPRLYLLVGQLAELPGWQQRFDLLNTVLARWIAEGPAWSPRVVWACRQLSRSGGGIPVRRLAECVGWSPRQLEYRFKEQIGLSPKAMARIYRLRRTVQLFADGWSPAQTVAACGFSDQAHLTRECRTMTGLTPARLRTVLHGVLDGPAVPDRLAGQVRSVVLTG